MKSGRQDSNLRPSAPKALYRRSARLGFLVIAEGLAVSVWPWRSSLGTIWGPFWGPDAQIV